MLSRTIRRVSCRFSAFAISSTRSTQISRKHTIQKSTATIPIERIGILFVTSAQLTHCPIAAVVPGHIRRQNRHCRLHLPRLCGQCRRRHLIRFFRYPPAPSLLQCHCSLTSTVFITVSWNTTYSKSAQQQLLRKPECLPLLAWLGHFSPREVRSRQSWLFWLSRLGIAASEILVG